MDSTSVDDNTSSLKRAADAATIDANAPIANATDAEDGEDQGEDDRKAKRRKGKHA